MHSALWERDSTLSQRLKVVGEGLDTFAMFESYWNNLGALREGSEVVGTFFWKSSAMFGDSWNIFNNEAVWK